MGRVYKALSKAGRSDRGSAARTGPARMRPRLPFQSSLNWAAGAATGPGAVTDSALTCEPPASLPAPLPDPVTVESQSGNSRYERIQFKIFKIQYSNVDDRLSAIKLTTEPIREIYRTLAVRVSSVAIKRDIKTIMITSARGGEGKTSTAANLAASLARTGQGRVLLLDGDFRRPQLAARLGILPRFGWGDVIEGRSSLADSIARIELGGLHVLVNKSQCQPRRSGTSENLLDLLTSERPDELMAELKQQFDLIVIDCPCITEYAEAQRLALTADGTILVVRAGYTHHRVVTDALKLVPKEKRMGIVLNDSET